MGAARERDQADFDLERFIDMFDTALTSTDPRVVNALQSLMMMTILTASETPVRFGRREGPLRRLFDDVYEINRRVSSLEGHFHAKYSEESVEKSYQAALHTASMSLAKEIDLGVLNSIKSKGFE